MSQTFLVQAQENRSIAGTEIRYRTVNVDQFKIFYREAGVRGAPAALPLHGFPTASHMFRGLIPLLALNFDATVSTEPSQPEVTIDVFRKAMRGLAGGVAVVTVGQGPYRTGFTATSVESLSAEPPRLLLSVRESSSSWRQLKKYPFFAVNILRADHQRLADQFAGRGGLQGLDRYGGASWTRLSKDGAAILNDALAGIDCAVEEILPRHGHAIVIGRVRAIVIRSNGHPLLYWQGAYRQIEQKQSAQQE